MTFTFDTLTFLVINAHARAPVLDIILPWFSDAWLLWAGGALFLACYAVYCRRRYGEALSRVLALALLVGLSVGVADLSCNVIKNATGRLRPFQSVEGTHFFTPDRQWTVIENPAYTPGTTGGSFPSSHAATSMAVALAVALLFRAASPWAFALPLLVGWSRVYVGKHFPLDVLVGWGVGMLSVLAVWALYYVIMRHFFKKRRRQSVA